MQNLQIVAAPQRVIFKPSARLQRVLELFGSALPADITFDAVLRGEKYRVGSGNVRFKIVVHNDRGISALTSRNERHIGEAYLSGDIDIEGDIVAALDLRTQLTESHPLAYLFWTYWRRLVFGEGSQDKQPGHASQEPEPGFYLLFLDEKHRCNSHGYFDSDDEPLETAMRRKLDTVIEACGMQPGWRVLDINAGWGAFTEYAGKRGIQVTSLAGSAESEKFVGHLVAREGLPCQVVRERFLDFTSGEPYDAIVSLGCTEHPPDHAATLAKCQKLLRPGGRVYIDACGSLKPRTASSFVRSMTWPGGAQPLQLDAFLDALSQSPLELLYTWNDRRSYLLTAKHWAENLERYRRVIVARWGERLYRRFRLYLWGCVQSLSTDDVTAYRLLLELPAGRIRV